MSRRGRAGAVRILALATILAGLAPAAARGQEFAYRGFAEGTLTLYPRTVPRDTTRVVGDVLFRFDPSVEISPGLSIAGSFDARADSHDETTIEGGVSFWDRTVERPALAVRRAVMTYARGPLTVELGKQFVRWGQTDILSPTDRFTPRDYLIVVSSDPVAVTAARVTLSKGSNSLGLVYLPRMTPSRLPILTHRWAGLSAASASVEILDTGSQFPGASQYGVRWNHAGRRLEWSASWFRGNNHLPLLDLIAVPQANAVAVKRRYPSMQSWGADLVAPLPWLAIKAEAGWFEPPDDDTDEYLLYVVQVERQHRDWLFIGGYVGEWVKTDRDVLAFAPDRGLARSLVARAGYTMGATRSLVLETVVRQNGDGVYGKAEYSHGLGQHWRIAVRMLLITGDEADFLGQYRRNSFAGSTVRYSF